jgi:predicted XRE-type DNA-binding protein
VSISNIVLATVRELVLSIQPASKFVTIVELRQALVSSMTGKYHLFSESRLFNFLNKLEQKIVIQITQHNMGEPLIDVALAK